MPSTGTDADPISFTDTNAETGASGGKMGDSSNMMSLIGKKRNEDSEDTGHKKKKKKKKGKKGKKKNMRDRDRYEPENYLFRIEGSICCAAIYGILMFIGFNLIVLIIVIIVSGGKIDHMFNVEEIQATTAAPTTA